MSLVNREGTSHTPYDDAFRTMMEKSGNLRIPFINEMFGLDKPLQEGTLVSAGPNEYYFDAGNGRQKKIITDSVLHIDGMTYHIECQSLNDGAILVRMFAYDVMIGLQESSYQNYHLHVKIPNSGVLFLRKTSRTPDQLEVTVMAQEAQMNYQVRVFCLADYSLDDLIQKNLLFLLPFYMFNLEREFKPFENYEKDAEEKVTFTLEKLLQYINQMYQHEKITLEQYLLVTDMLRKVTDHLTQKYDRVRKELDHIMGGKVLEFKGERLLKQGRAEGKIDELLSLVCDGIITEDCAEERASRLYGICPEEFKKRLSSFHPDELLQG